MDHGSLPADDVGVFSEPKLRKHGDAELNETRRALVDAAYGFLVRSYNEGMIEEPKLRQAVAEIGTSIERRDLKR